MTIALGVLCSDGVVLGVDLEYTQDFMSMPGQKMFWFPERFDSNYYVLIAAAGNVDSSKTFVELLKAELLQRFPDGRTTLRELKRAIRDTLKQVWLEHIDSAPLNERRALGFDLLIATRVDFSCRLFRTNRTMLVEETLTACNGVGMYVGRCLTDLLLGHYPTIELASQVVTYIIWAAKQHIQYVGKGSDIHILPYKGLPYSVLKPDRENVEKNLGELFGAMRDVIACADGGDFAGDRLAERVGRLKDTVEKLRAAQKKRKVWREYRAAYSEAVSKGQPVPPIPRDDQQFPQPSLALPGGPDGS